jgi:hypothetical protein
MPPDLAHDALIIVTAIVSGLVGIWKYLYVTTDYIPPERPLGTLYGKKIKSIDYNVREMNYLVILDDGERVRINEWQLEDMGLTTAHIAAGFNGISVSKINANYITTDKIGRVLTTPNRVSPALMQEFRDSLKPRELKVQRRASEAFNPRIKWSIKFARSKMQTAIQYSDQAGTCSIT